MPRIRDPEALSAPRLERLVDRATTSLAVNLREWRERAALTQEALAEKASLSAIYVQALERGQAANPSLRVLVSLAFAVGCEAGELLAPQRTLRPRKPGRPRRTRSQP